MKKKTVKPDPLAHLYLDKFEVAALLRVSHRTIEVWMARNLIPFRRIGRTVRFNREEIEAHQQKHNLVPAHA